MQGRVLISTPLDRESPPEAHYEAWELAAGFIGREISPRAALVLAEPEADPALGTVVWSTPLSGIPRPLAELRDRQRKEADQAVREAAGEFSGAAARRAESPDPLVRQAARLTSLAAAQLAAAAAGLAAAGTVFIVEGQPVLAPWTTCLRAGEGEESAAPVASEASEDRFFQDSSAHGSWNAFQAGPGASGPYEAASPEPAWGSPQYGEPGSLNAPAAAPSARVPALRAGLAGLAAFLIVLLAFGLMSPAFRKAAGALRAPAAGPAPGLPGHDEEAALRRELADLKDRYGMMLFSCRRDPPAPPPAIEPLPEPAVPSAAPPPAAGDPPLHVEPDPPHSDPPEPEPVPPAPPPEPEPAPPAPPPEPEPAPPAPPPEPEPAPPAPPPEPEPAPPAQPPEPARPKRGSELEIPDKPTDLAFLKGCWKSDANLFNQVNNRSILCYYCFDGKGNAQVRVEEFDGRGKVVLVCRTTGTARLDGEGIIIRDRGAECPPPEPSYAPDIVTCTRTSSGTASCVIRGGDSVARTVLTYQGD